MTQLTNEEKLSIQQEAERRYSIADEEMFDDRPLEYPAYVSERKLLQHTFQLGAEWGILQERKAREAEIERLKALFEIEYMVLGKRYFLSYGFSESSAAEKTKGCWEVLKKKNKI